MQPLKITIYGDFWDCQIYRGRFYLWTMNGTLLTYNWDEFIESLIVNDYQRLPIECAFSRGDFLYNKAYSSLFRDAEIKNVLIDKFNQISKINFEFDTKYLEDYLYGAQDNPFKELPTDTEIYYNELYAIIEKGLWKSKSHRSNAKYPVSTKPRQLTDYPLISLKVKGNRIALSGGSEGLFEYDVGDVFSPYEEYYSQVFKEVDHNLFLISPKHSLFSDWSFSSIYSSSDIDDSFMAAFNWLEEDDHLRRVFNKIIDQTEIFKTDNLKMISWGSNDKIYRANNGGLDVVRFTQKYIGSESEIHAFSDVKHIPFYAWKGKIISGGVALFGTIVECENALVVLQSDENIYNIKGSVTKWRVYPRSIRYENHLHVILDDRIEIYSFNNDYFIDQGIKDMGIKYNKNNLRME